MYSKIVKDLSQAQTIANARALFAAEYFGPYAFIPGRSKIHANIISVDNIGYESSPHSGVSQVGDLSGMVDMILSSIDARGRLYEANFTLAPPEKLLRTLGFEEGMYKTGVSLPLSIFILNNERTAEQPRFSFRVSNLGLQQEYDARFPETKRKLGHWYTELTHHLNKILPYKVTENKECQP